MYLGYLPVFFCGSDTYGMYHCWCLSSYGFSWYKDINMPNQLSQVKTLGSSSGKPVETKCLKSAIFKLLLSIFHVMFTYVIENVT